MGGGNRAINLRLQADFRLRLINALIELGTNALALQEVGLLGPNLGPSARSIHDQ